MPREKGDRLALFNEIRDGRCIPFVGAGLSLNAEVQPMPAYSQLAELLLDNLDTETQKVIDPTADPAHVFELLAERRGDRWLKDQVCRFARAARSGAVHKAFAQVPWPGVITSNYDTLIEDAYKDLGWSVIRCASESEVSNFVHRNDQTQEISVVKVHGDCDHYRSMVVRPSSLAYDRFTAAFPQMSRFLESALGIWSAIFIGYSLRDPDVTFLRSVLDVMQNRAGTEKRRDYMFLLDPSEEEVGARETQGLIPILLRTDGSSAGAQSALQTLFQSIQAHCEHLGRLRDKLPHRKPVSKAVALRAERLPGAVETNHEPVTREITSLISELQDDGNPVVALWTTEDLTDSWMPWMGRLAGRLEGSVIFLQYDTHRANASEMIPYITKQVCSSLRVPLAIIDFTDRVPASLAATACRSCNTPTIGVAQDGGNIPVFMYDLTAIYVYRQLDLDKIDSATVESLSRKAERFMLVYRLSEAEEHVRDARYDAAVVALSSVLETGARYLVEEVCEAKDDEVSVEDFRRMVSYLAQQAAGNGLEIDRDQLHKMWSLRNDVVHKGRSASRQQSEEMLSFSERFIKVNLGPNLISFASGEQAQEVGE